MFKGDDYPGPCGLQADKVMMAATFQLSPVNLPGVSLCLPLCVLFAE